MASSVFALILLGDILTNKNRTKWLPIKPHISGVFCLLDDGCILELVCNKIIDCKGSFYYVSSTPFILMRLTYSESYYSSINI